MTTFLRLSLWLCLACLQIGAAGLFSTAAQADCLRSTREAKLPDGSSRLKVYVCNLDKSSGPAVQIEMDDLSEAAAGGMLESEPSPEMKAAYGNVELLHNGVFAKAKEIFDNYGIREITDGCIVFNVVSRPGDAEKRAGLGDCAQRKRTIWYLTYPQSEQHTAKYFPEAWKLRVVADKWPKGWNFYYTKCEDDTPLINCFMLWRPMTQTDLRNYDHNIKVYEAKIGAAMKIEGRENDATGWPDAKGAAADRFFLMVDHIANGNLPPDFLTIVDRDPVDCGCDDSVGFSGIHVRQMVLETAFVKNISSQPLKIDGLLGQADENEALRRADGVGASAIPAIEGKVIAPGETLAIPLRIRFIPAASLAMTFKDKADAEATYRRIHASPPGSRLKSQGCNPDISVKPDSFGPPTVPNPVDYAYGPAIRLSGLTLNGAGLSFDNPSSNFFRLAMGASAGSCPYLYAYDEAEKDWVRRGKILDDANGAEKERAERTSFAGLATRFQIREEEFELALIHEVRLELQLKDGSILTLKPANRLRPEPRDHFDRIKYRAIRDYRFNPPDTANNVLRSTLVVDGYYRRYSAMPIIN